MDIFLNCFCSRSLGAVGVFLRPRFVAGIVNGRHFGWIKQRMEGTLAVAARARTPAVQVGKPRTREHTTCRSEKNGGLVTADSRD
jgi:hypothetical protein